MKGYLTSLLSSGRMKRVTNCPHPPRGCEAVPAMAGMGHEEWFPPSRLSDGSGLRKETIAGRQRNGRDAPKNEPARGRGGGVAVGAISER